MSSDVQQCEPVPIETQSPQKRKSQDVDPSEPEAKKSPSDLFSILKKSIISTEFSNLNELNSQIELALLEKYFLENRLVYWDYPKWFEVHSKRPRNKILRDYLLSHFNPTELNALPEKCLAHLDLKLRVNSPGPSSTSEQFKSIAECAKHEAQILQRISQLRKEGLWSIKRLPKLVEPARPKTHWDYLLDEMVWMSTDFSQERKWKINTCRKISLAVQKYFKDREIKSEMAEREEQKRVRKQAGLVAKEIQQFWKQVSKLIEYKQRSICEEKRKIQMDKHLNFIVDQTEKYSSWLMQSLNQSREKSDDDSSEENEISDKETTSIESDDDRPDVDDELAKLRQESELDLNELLKDYNLNESYFGQYFKSDNNRNKENEDNEEIMSNETDNDNEEDDEILSDDMSDEEDDEETIEQDEKMDKEYDAEKELAELKADFELPIEQLIEKLKKPTEKEHKPVVKMESNEQNEGLDSIAAHAESFQPTGYTLETTNVKTRIPSELLKHNLREYQHVGLDWLVTMYENKLNGILADEMGLGKTIQTIALLAHLAVDKGIWGPHLIVVPTSVMLNWELEFKKWCPGFKILTYYGSQKERKVKRIGWTKANAFHVCITSYKLVIQDHAIFRRKKWKYFILDEAQNIKNFKSQRWQSLFNFQSQRRLLLTGTPLQNNLMELWSLMHFLMPHVFASHRQFNHWFNNPFKSMIEKSNEVNEQLITRLHKVLRPFILRRLKTDVEKQMPKKYEHVIKCALSKRQRLLYDEFMSLSSTKEKIAEGHYMSVINILMQLRKVCNHPDLFEPRPIVSSFVTQPIEYSVPSIVFNLKDHIHSEQVDHYHPGLADLECLSAFDSHRAKRLQITRQTIEQCLKQENENRARAETRTSFFHRQTLVGIESSITSPTRSNSLELTDHSIKINYLARLNKLRFVFHKPVYGRDLVDFVTSTTFFSLNQHDKQVSFRTRSYVTSVLTQKSNSYLEYTDSLKNSLDLTHNYLMGQMRSICEKFTMYVPNVRYPNSYYVTLRIAKPHVALYEKYTRIKQPIVVEQFTNTVCNNYTELNQIVNSQTCTQFPEKRLIQYDCGKLQSLDKLLRELFCAEHRVLIFTQMTRMLDVLENFLNYHGYKYLRLDGATSIEQRQVLMERFNTDKRIFCFILSTRSGGVGVNLTGADTVIFYDSDWNPTMDAQAQDRCHRIGQTRDVHIYRLISEKTIEENILKKANQKRLLSQMAIEGGCFTTAVLRQSHITELFEEEKQEESISDDNNMNMDELSIGANVASSKFEEALDMVEDESDVSAAKNLREEVKADIAEFDENDNLTDVDLSKLENQFKFIETELKPIERYALKYLESTGEVQIENDAEPDIEQVKKNWELERLKQLKEEEERKAEQEEEDLIYTYTKTEVRKSTRPVKSRPVSCEKKEKLIDPRPTTKKDKKENLVKEKVIEARPLSPVKDETIETKRPSRRGRKPKQKSDESPPAPPVQESVPKPIPTEKPKVLTLSPNVQSAPKPVLKTIITRPSVPIKSIFNIPTTLNRSQSNSQPIILKTNNVINVPATSPNKLIFRTVIQKPSSVLSSTCLSPSPSSSNSSSQSK